MHLFFRGLASIFLLSHRLRTDLSGMTFLAGVPTQFTVFLANQFQPFLFDRVSFSPPLYLPYSNGENHSIQSVGRDSNPHTFRYWILSPARLPIPPPTDNYCSPNCQSSIQFLELNYKSKFTNFDFSCQPPFL